MAQSKGKVGTRAKERWDAAVLRRLGSPLGTWGDLDLWQAKDLESGVFGWVARKRLAGEFFGCAANTGVRRSCREGSEKEWLEGAKCRVSLCGWRRKFTLKYSTWVTTCQGKYKSFGWHGIGQTNLVRQMSGYVPSVSDLPPELPPTCQPD